MKRFILVLVLLITANIVFAQNQVVANKSFEINTNNTSIGTITFNSNGTSGNLRFQERGGIFAEIINVTIKENPLGSYEIFFLRTGAYKQYYNGWISSDGKIITGYLINVNENITTIEKFPFYATKT